MATKFKLVTYSALILILFLALIRIFIDGTTGFFILELLGLLFLMLLTFIAFFGFTEGWGEKFLFFVFLFYLGNLVLIWFYQGPLYLVLTFLALLGLILSVPTKKRVPAVSYIDTPEPYSEIIEPVKTFDPGKYVASKRGKYYHEANSEWAKKINKSNQVWFQSKEDAWEQGYKAHPDVN